MQWETQQSALIWEKVAMMTCGWRADNHNNKTITQQWDRRQDCSRAHGEGFISLYEASDTRRNSTWISLWSWWPPVVDRTYNNQPKTISKENMEGIEGKGGTPAVRRVGKERGFEAVVDNMSCMMILQDKRCPQTETGQILTSISCYISGISSCSKHIRRRRLKTCLNL
jgi:hypothetical protein